VLPAALGQDPQDVPAVLVEPAVEADERGELPGRVTGSLGELGHHARDVGAPLGGVDQRGRQPCLAAVGVVDGRLGDAGALGDGADARPRPPLLEEPRAGGDGDELPRALRLVVPQLGSVRP
jgi:hypothetical protein